MIIKGYCPTLEKDHTIDVEYIDASTLEGREYIKGLFTCSIASYGGKCSVANECPLYKSAPNTKR